MRRQKKHDMSVEMSCIFKEWNFQRKMSFIGRSWFPTMSMSISCLFVWWQKRYMSCQFKCIKFSLKNFTYILYIILRIIFHGNWWGTIDWIPKIKPKHWHPSFSLDSSLTMLTTMTSLFLWWLKRNTTCRLKCLVYFINGIFFEKVTYRSFVIFFFIGLHSDSVDDYVSFFSTMTYRLKCLVYVLYIYINIYFHSRKLNFKNMVSVFVCFF